MADPTDYSAYAAQLAGMNDEQQRLLMQSARLQQMRGQHSQDPGGFGFGAAADTVRNAGIGMRQHQLDSQEADVSKRLASARGGLLGVQDANQETDPYAVPSGTPAAPVNGPPTLGQVQTGEADNAAKQGRVLKAAMAARLSGDPIASEWGQRTEEQIRSAPERKLKQTMEQMRIAEGKTAADEGARVRGEEADPASRRSVLRAALAKRLGMAGVEGAPANTIGDKEMELAERLRAAELRRAGLGGGRGAGGASGPPILSPAALDQAAENYAKTGKMPAFGQGKDAAVLKQQVMTRAAELHPENDLPSSAAGYHADTSSLAHLQATTDAVKSFEATAQGNLQRAEDAMGGLVDSGSPLLNVPLRQIQTSMGGSADAAKAKAAMTTAMTEIAKVLNGGTAAGAISDSARAEAEKMIDPDRATMAQVHAVVGLLRKDMAGRSASLDAQLGEIRGRTRGGKAAAPAGDGRMGATAGEPKTIQLSAASADAEYAALPSGSEFTDPEGKRRRKP